MLHCLEQTAKHRVKQVFGKWEMSSNSAHQMLVSFRYTSAHKYAQRQCYSHFCSSSLTVHRYKRYTHSLRNVRTNCDAA